MSATAAVADCDGGSTDARLRATRYGQGTLCKCGHSDEGWQRDRPSDSFEPFESPALWPRGKDSRLRVK